MIVTARMADGRTTFQFASRGDLVAALGHELDDSKPRHCWVKWNLEDPEWIPARVQHLRKASVAFVVAAEDHDLGVSPEAAEIAAKRKADWEAREAAGQ